MRIYITGLDVQSINLIKSKIPDFNPNILRAYDHVESNQKLYDLINNKDTYDSLVCDSGTYVLNSKILKKMKEEEKEKFIETCFLNYVNWLKSYSKDFTFYLNFDIAFEGELAFTRNKEYFERLEAMGFKPVFVIHSFEDEEINYVLEKKPEYVAIASAKLKDKEFDNVIPYVKLFYDNKIKVHLLGCASYNHLIKAKYAWSCDASSYGRWAGFNKVIYFSKIMNKEVKLSISKYSDDGKLNKDYMFSEKNKCLLDEYRDFISPLLPLNRVCAGGKYLTMANAYYMTVLEKIVTDYQKANGVEFDRW